MIASSALFATVFPNVGPTDELVAKLAAKWMFPIAGGQRLEVTPIVVDGVMYVTMANEAYAVDAKNGREIWHYSRPLTPDVVGDAVHPRAQRTAVLESREAPPQRDVDVLQQITLLVGVPLIGARQASERRSVRRGRLGVQRVLSVPVCGHRFCDR